MQKTFLKKDIENLKSLIKKTNSKSQKRDYIIVLKSLLLLLSDLENKDITYNIPSNLSLEYLKTLEINNKNILFNQISDTYYSEFIKSICKKGLQHLKNYQEELFFYETINFLTAKDLILDFFNQFDERLYPIIKNALNNNRLFVIQDRNQNGDGYSLYNPYSNSPYTTIFIDKKIRLNNISCLVHEFGHTISNINYKTNPKSFNQTVYNSFIEVPSFVFEFMFLDFLIENKIYEKEAEKCISNNLCTLNCYLNFLKIINRVIKDINISKEYQIEEIQTILRKSGIVQDEILSEICFDNIPGKYQYSYGILTAEYYLEKYRKDKEKYKNFILSFINNIGYQNDFYMLNNFGISIDEFKECGYLKDEVKRNQKILLKKD